MDTQSTRIRADLGHQGDFDYTQIEALLRMTPEQRLDHHEDGGCSSGRLWRMPGYITFPGMNAEADRRKHGEPCYLSCGWHPRQPDSPGFLLLAPAFMPGNRFGD